MPGKLRLVRRVAVPISLALVAMSSLAWGARWVAPTRAEPRDPVAGPVEPLNATSWFGYGLRDEVRFQLDPRADLDLLRDFAQPGARWNPDWRPFWSGRYGARALAATPLAWLAPDHDPEAAGDEQAALPRAILGDLTTVASLELVHLTPPLGWASAWEALAFSPGATGVAPAPRDVGAMRSPTCAPGSGFDRPVTFGRWGNERDSFRLLDCDGSVADEALDRLSVIARPPSTPRPELPLPAEADPDATVAGEWLPHVRLVHPRLVWVVAQLAAAFPGRPIYVVSGYRRDAHGGFHQRGRALDLSMQGVSNEELIAVCRRLGDVGCGYYPHHPFVHVDVRAPATGHALWIDDSLPSQPSHYVDSWPGVIDGGALAWAGGE